MKLKNSALQELYDTLVSAGVSTFSYADSPVYKAFKECDDELSESITFAHIKDLQDRNDILRKSEAALLKANVELASKKRQFEKDLDDAKKQLNYFTHSRDDWRARAKHAEKEIEDLKKNNNRLAEALQDTKTTLEKANADRTNLQEAVDELSGENRSLNASIGCLRLEVNWYRKHYKEQSDKILGLKSRLNSMYGVYGVGSLNKIPDITRGIGYENGQINLWNMLQNVNDAKPFELTTCFPDVTCMDDILSWDLEDFLDAYKSWQERIKKIRDQKETDRMRDWLYRFCRRKFFCKGCPLASNEYECGRGYSFKGARPVPDEDIERYYEKATLEGTIEIDKDLPNKICGIDSDD